MNVEKMEKKNFASALYLMNNLQNMVMLVYESLQNL